MNEQSALVHLARMFNHCALALLHSGENRPDPKHPPEYHPSEYLVLLRRVARARRLSEDGLVALEQICAIWEPNIATFMAGKTPLHFTMQESEELATSINTVEIWLKANFPAAFPKS